MKPEVSIVIPVYKRPQFIGALMEGLFAQTFQNWECIFVDDESNMPELTEVCRRYEQLDGRVRYVRMEKNGGVSAARNRGVAETFAGFILFHDDDDVSHPQRLEKSVAFMRENPQVAAVGCYNININEAGKIVSRKNADLVSSQPLIQKESPPLKKKGKGAVGAAAFVRRDCLLAVGGYDERFRIAAEDMELVLRLEEKFPLAMLREELLYYRRTAGGHLSFSPMQWQYFAFAYVLAHCRRNNLPEPPGQTPSDFLPHMKDLSDALVSSLIYKAAKNAAKRLLRARRYAELGGMLDDFAAAFSYSPKYMAAMRRDLLLRALYGFRLAAFPVIRKAFNRDTDE